MSSARPTQSQRWWGGARPYTFLQQPVTRVYWPRDLDIILQTVHQAQDTREAKSSEIQLTVIAFPAKKKNFNVAYYVCFS